MAERGNKGHTEARFHVVSKGFGKTQTAYAVHDEKGLVADIEYLDDDGKAIAHLFASGSDMLEALKDVREWLIPLVGSEPHLEKIDAAIAKAQGAE